VRLSAPASPAKLPRPRADSAPTQQGREYLRAFTLSGSIRRRAAQSEAVALGCWIGRACPAKVLHRSGVDADAERLKPSSAEAQSRHRHGVGCSQIAPTPPQAVSSERARLARRTAPQTLTRHPFNAGVFGEQAAESKLSRAGVPACTSEKAASRSGIHKASPNNGQLEIERPRFGTADEAGQPKLAAPAGCFPVRWRSSAQRALAWQFCGSGGERRQCACVRARASLGVQLERRWAEQQKVTPASVQSSCPV
jgi:hypothetical protein